MCESMDKNRIQGVSIGQAGNLPQSPYPSRMRNVDSATVHGRQLNLPQEICSVSLGELDGQRRSDRRAEVSRGAVRQVASSVRLVRRSNAERRSQQMGQAGNGN